MNRRGLCVLVLAGVLLPSRGAFAEPAILAVFNIEDARADKTRLSKNVLDSMSEYLSAQLARLPAYRVLPSAELRAVLAAKKAESYQSCFSDACRIEIGRELAAQKTVSMRISRVGEECISVLTVYDLRTAATELAATERGGCTEKVLLSTIETLVRAVDPDKASTATAETKVAPNSCPEVPVVNATFDTFYKVRRQDGGLESTLATLLAATHAWCTSAQDASLYCGSSWIFTLWQSSESEQKTTVAARDAYRAFAKKLAGSQEERKTAVRTWIATAKKCGAGELLSPVIRVYRDAVHQYTSLKSQTPALAKCKRTCSSLDKDAGWGLEHPGAATDDPSEIKNRAWKGARKSCYQGCDTEAYALLPSMVRFVHRRVQDGMSVGELLELAQIAGASVEAP
jgi:hypothetical protein